MQFTHMQQLQREYDGNMMSREKTLVGTRFTASPLFTRESVTPTNDGADSRPLSAALGESTMDERPVPPTERNRGSLVLLLRTGQLLRFEVLIRDSLVVETPHAADPSA